MSKPRPISLRSLFCRSILAIVGSVPFVPIANGASFVVTDLSNAGAGSLRQAIIDADANAEADTITFSVTGTINLQSALPRIDTKVEIFGPGADQLTIRRAPGAGSFRIFFVEGSADVTLSGMTIADGRSTEGGAVFSLGDLLIDGCTIRNHVNFLGGNGIGAIANVKGVLEIRNSTVRDNRSLRSSAIHNQDGTTRISTTTISGNTVTVGSGAAVLSVASTSSAVVEIFNCTITDNTSLDDISAAVHNQPNFPQTATMRIRNSIIAGNSAPGDVFALFGGVISQGHNLIGDNDFSIGVFNAGTPNPMTDFVGTNASPLDPLLFPLQDNGGSTATHSLRLGSFAIDGAANGQNPATDQRGEPRIVDGDCNFVDRADIGAFELEDCRRGNVNRGAGLVQDVLFVNDSAGIGSEKVVAVGVAESITVRMDSALEGPASGRYVVYVWLDCPANPTVFSAGGLNLGILTNPSPFQAPAGPQAFKCLLGTGLPSALCQGLRTIGAAPPSTPWMATRSQGFGNPGLKLTLQGLLEDDGSGNDVRFSVTNAVIVEVVP